MEGLLSPLSYEQNNRLREVSNSSEDTQQIRGRVWILAQASESIAHEH